MSVGKITYGRKKKTIGDIEELLPKKPADEIFDAVAEDLDEDHQKYINEILKLTKTPVKQRQSRDKVDLKDAKEPKQIEQPLKSEQPKDKISSSRIRRDISETEIYDKINLRKEERPKFFSGYHPAANQKYEPVKLSAGSDLTNRLIKDIEARRSREKTMPNLTLKEKLEPQSGRNVQNRTFLECISEYICQLETENPKKTTKMDLIVAENKKLRKKVALYEERLKQTKNAIEQHLDHQKNKEKQYKNKIKKLTHALTQAVDKVNEQKDQIEYLQGFLNNFTHQVRAYKHSRTNKQKLTQLLKEEADDYNKFQEVLLRTLNSEDLKMDYPGSGIREHTKDELDLSIGNQNETSQEHLAKIMNTNSYLPISRSKPSRTIPRAQGSKSLSKESKNPFRKNTQTTYINRVCRFQESQTD